MRSSRSIAIVLLALVVFDALLVLWAFGFPEWWFVLFHTTEQATPGAELFLKRCGANWAAFALFQGLALKYWKSSPHWLAIVAGLRLGDSFTDVTYVVFAPDPTWIAIVALPAAGIINLILGWYFLTCYFQRRSVND